MLAASKNPLIKSFRTWRLAAAMLTVLLPIFLIGCGNQTDGEAGKVVIEWYVPATPAFLQLYNDYLIPAFERSHPDIKVRLNPQLGDTGYDPKLLTLVAGGIAPDVAHFTEGDYPIFAAKGLLLDIRQYAESDKDFSMSDYFEPVMRGLAFAGRYYGLPSDFSTIALVYNKDIFDKAGIPYPNDSWDWSKFLDIAKKLTVDEDNDGVPDQFGFLNTNSYNRWPAWVWMNGGEIMSSDMKRCLMDQPAAYEGLKFYIELSTKWNVAPAPGQDSGQAADDLFASGKVGMIANSRYAYKGPLKKVDFRWDVALMPKGKKRATSLIWGCNSIMASTRHPKESWEFIKFLSQREGALLNVKAGNAIPAYKKVALTPGMLKSDMSPPHDGAFIRAVPFSQTAPYPPQSAEFLQARNNLNDAFLGLVTPETACRRFARDVNEFLKEGQ